MWLTRAANWLNRIVRPISGVIHSVGLGVLGLMMLLTASDVTLRYVFNRPIGGSFDLTVYMMTIVVAFALAYCAVQKGHVRVDFVVDRLPQRAQAIIDSATGLLGLGLVSLISWQCFINIKAQYIQNVESSVLHIPTFPFVGVVALGIACFTLVLLADFLDFLSQAVKR